MKDIPFKIKIIAGYLIASLAVAFILWYVYVYIVPLITNRESEKEQVFEKAILTGSTLTYLNESELLTTIYIQDPTQKNYSNYLNSINKVYRNIDTLSNITKLPAQQVILKELVELLNQKNTNLHEIVSQIDIEKEAFIKQNWGILKSSIDSIYREKIRFDSLLPTTSNVKKKNLFRRIADVFSPSSQDTIIHHAKVVQTFVDDTIHSSFTNSDTIINTTEKVLNDIDKIYKKKLKNKQVVSEQLQTLLSTNRTINTQINSLLDELQKEALTATAKNIIAKQALLKKSGYIILSICILAIILIVLFIIFIFNDINKSKRYRKDLELARIHAEELMQSREKLLLTISHDIKAPLSSIAGYIELMNESNLEQNDREYLSSMNNSIKHVMDLLGNLLEYSRLEANKTILIPEVSCIYNLFGDVVSSFYPLAAKKNIDLKYNNNIDKNLFVNIDKIRLKQILTNLLSNALKFTTYGEVVVSASLKEDIEGEKGILCFSISDTGCGIPSEKRKVIFEEFSQINASTNRNKEGSGFGLFIVKRIIDLFQGSINVSENKKSGCIFSVQLPLDIISKTEVTEKKSTFPLSTSTLKASILVVDDEISQLKLMEKILTKIGHTVTISDNINDAIKLLNERYFDLLITDIQLNNSSGFDLLELIKTSDNKYLQLLPIIAVSASEEYDEEYFIEKGFLGFIKKPFTIEQLHNGLKEIITSITSYELDNFFKMMGNDEDSIKQIIELFISSAKENTSLMKTYLDNENYLEIKLLAHKMLPMFYQLEILKLADVLSMIESYKINKNNISLFKELVLSLINRSEYIFSRLNLFILKEK